MQEELCIRQRATVLCAERRAGLILVHCFPLFSITTLPQSPLPSHPHSWLPSTKPPYLGFLTLFCAPTFLPVSPHSSYIYACNTPIQLIIHACTAVTHDAITIVSRCWGSHLNQCRADLEHDTLATPRFRYRCSAMLTPKIKKTAVTLSDVHTKIRQIWRAIDVEQCGFNPCRC